MRPTRTSTIRVSITEDFRALLTHQPIDAHDIVQLVEALLTGLAG